MSLLSFADLSEDHPLAEEIQVGGVTTTALIRRNWVRPTAEGGIEVATIVIRVADTVTLDLNTPVVIGDTTYKARQPERLADENSVSAALEEVE